MKTTRVILSSAAFIGIALGGCQTSPKRTTHVSPKSNARESNMRVAKHGTLPPVAEHRADNRDLEPVGDMGSSGGFTGTSGGIAPASSESLRRLNTRH